MRKADVQVGTLYRYSPRQGTAGLAVVLSVTDQYGTFRRDTLQHRHGSGTGSSNVCD
jgi:hypothetical protein